MLGHFAFFAIRYFGNSLLNKSAANKTKKHEFWTEHNPFKFAVMYNLTKVSLELTRLEMNYLGFNVGFTQAEMRA